MTTAYPLAWPEGWPRIDDRVSARFGTRQRGPKFESLTVDESAARVRAELAALEVTIWNVVISTNLELRRDGTPRAVRGGNDPDDPGVAVYWTDKAGDRRCMAVDRYHRVADNLAAIAATLEAMRAIERHGGAEILNRAFTGFEALPPPPTERSWCGVLGLDAYATRAKAEANYRELAVRSHPDNGGSHEAMVELNAAIAEARRVLK